MNLTIEDVALLKQLKAAGDVGRTIRAYNTRLVLDRLAKARPRLASSRGSATRNRIEQLADKAPWKMATQITLIAD
jgi:hypothetical protein